MKKTCKNRTLLEEKIILKKKLLTIFFYLWILFRGGTGQQHLFSALLNAICLKRDIASQTLGIFEIWSKMDLFEGYISKPTNRIE